MGMSNDINSYDPAWPPILIWERKGCVYLTLDRGRQGLEDVPVNRSIEEAHEYFHMAFTRPSMWQRLSKLLGIQAIVSAWARRRGQRIAREMLAKYSRATAKRHASEAKSRELMMKQQYQEARSRGNVK